VSLWYIEPRDPLVVRDGRPNNGRSESTTLPFPYPGTIAGVVRTRLGSNEHGAFVMHDRLDELRRVALRGPLLVRPFDQRLFVPPPRDCLVLEDRQGSKVVRALHPILPVAALADHALTTLPVGQEPQDVVEGKPPRGLSAWWTWSSLETWLVKPGRRDGAEASALVQDALPRLPTDARVHVMLGKHETAEEGMLFQATGLCFQLGGGRDLLSLLVDVNASVLGNGAKLRAGVGPCGGERRLVRWSEAGQVVLPALPEQVRAWLSGPEATVRVRLVLLTPAVFEAGWRPGSGAGQLLAGSEGVRVELVAACVPRPETISGWDFARNAPKRSRRLVSAGSVYWLDLQGSPEERVRWAERVWLSNVSDDEQDRRDGFGLAVVGVGT
jgi:CRISPR-associated protein Cmr3